MSSRLPALLCLFLLVGCGGGHSSDTGRVAITIHWPDRSRLIPLASNSVAVVLNRGGQVIASQLLPRPANGNTTTADFNGVKTGSLTLAATAFPNVDGSGVADATGTVAVSVLSGQTSNVALTMSSTIDHIDVSPSNPSILAAQSVQLSATARDKSGSIVLMSSSKIAWSSSTGAASVDSSGKVTGLLPGTATITVQDQESGVAGSSVVTVSASTDAMPITVSGFNADVVFEKATTSSASPFDDSTTTWIENGIQNHSGLPPAKFASRLTNPVTGGKTYYQFQPFTANNALTMLSANPTGTLTLSQPGPFRTVSIAAVSSNARMAAETASLTLNFSDGSVSPAIDYHARDWWAEGGDNDPNRILTTGAYRALNAGSGVSSGNIQIDTIFRNFNLFETTIDLSNIGGVDYSTRPLNSITFNLASGARLTAIFAISGIPSG